MSKYHYSGGFSMGDFITKYLLEDNSEFAISKVIYNNPVTIVMWDDGTKTVCKCAPGDVYSKETGLTICILKKIIGATNLHNIFKDWIPEDKDIISLSEIRKKYKNA